MTILRPDENTKPSITSLLRHGIQFKLLCLVPFTARFQRGFFRRAPSIFTYGASAKIGISKTHFEFVPAILGSSKNSRFFADFASELGFFEEAAALYITSARLSSAAMDWFYKIEGKGATVPQMKAEQLYAFEGLGKIRALPEDDLDYWQDRLAQSCAALLPDIAAFPHKGEKAISAILALEYVAQVIRNLIPLRINKQLTPLPIAHFYLGGHARIYTALAHTEVIAGFAESAIGRISALLTEKIEEVDDLVYALITGLAAARLLDNVEYRNVFLKELGNVVDTPRSNFRSFEGRLFSLQTVFHQFRYGTEVWAIDKIHHAEDMFAIAELLKARILLDEINACYTSSSKYLTDGNDTNGDSRPTIGAEQNINESVENGADGNSDFFSREDLSPETLKEMEKLSYWSFDGKSSYADSNSKLSLNRMIFDNTNQSIGRIENYVKSHGGGYKGTASPKTLEDIQFAIAEDELLIEFFIPRDPYKPNQECWILTVSKHKVDKFPLYIDTLGKFQEVRDDKLIERGPLSDLAAELRMYILSKQDAKADEILATFFEYFISPVIRAGYAPEKFKRWIIVPHGPLHLLPFQSLKDEQNRYLIERVAICTAPSASVWWHMRNKKFERNQINLLGIGNPSLSEGYSSLPEAEDEVSRIADKLSWVNSTILTGEQASETRVKAAINHAGIVHFATHGRLDMANPRDGHSILLSKDANEDGLLTASEIRSMQLEHLQLVILNICDGAVCRYGSGDEPLGLLSAFIQAGAGNAIGGLWELPDAASKMFILQFYNALDSTAPDAAIRFAAKHAIAKKRPLLYWAGFQLVGSGEMFFRDVENSPLSL